MTKEEAIEEIRYYCQDSEKIIKILEQQPCEDCVSRQAMLKEIPRLWNSRGDKDYCMETLRDFVTELPPVTPTRKKGKWILTDDDFVYCSECEDSYYPRPIDASWCYCPNCGAEMESE